MLDGQVPLEVCNNVLIGINEYLALEERKTQSFTEVRVSVSRTVYRRRTSEPQLGACMPMISQEEIAPVVQNRLANVKLKTMLNALVDGGRMAIGQEGGIPVYMVKRFYAC